MCVTSFSVDYNFERIFFVKKILRGLVEFFFKRKRL